TANDNRKQVSDAVIEAMHDVLDVAVPSKFEQIQVPLDQAIAAKVIVPVELVKNRYVINGQDIPDAQAGSVAILLNNIEPPLSPDEINNRVRGVTSSIPGAEFLQNISVTRTDGNPDIQKPARSAVVLISNKNFTYERSPTDWKEKMARP